MQYFTSASAIKIWGNSKHDSLETKGNHLADISARNAILKGTNNSQTSVIIHRDISLNDTLEKTGYRSPKIEFSKRKNKIGNLTIVCLEKRGKYGLDQITQSYQKL